MSELKTMSSEQLELEQKYLILDDIQREVFQVLLINEKAINKFNIRMEIYNQRVLKSYLNDKLNNFSSEIVFCKNSQEIIQHAQKEQLLKKGHERIINLFQKIKETRPADYEKMIRGFAKQQAIQLPSNVKINSSLKILESQGLVCKNILGDYLIAPEFYCNWKQIRSKIIDSKISLDSFTPMQLEFWHLK